MKLNNETYWIEAINNRMKTGAIDENTLVISDTGHTPAIAYAMAQKFHSDIYMNLPAKQEKNRKGTQDQIQTFAEGIRDGVNAGPRVGTSTLLAKLKASRFTWLREIVDMRPPERAQAPGGTQQPGNGSRFGARNANATKDAAKTPFCVVG